MRKVFALSLAALALASSVEAQSFTGGGGGNRGGGSDLSFNIDFAPPQNGGGQNGGQENFFSTLFSAILGGGGSQGRNNGDGQRGFNFDGRLNGNFDGQFDDRNRFDGQFGFDRRQGQTSGFRLGLNSGPGNRDFNGGFNTDVGLTQRGLKLSGRLNGDLSQLARNSGGLNSGGGGSSNVGGGGFNNGGTGFNNNGGSGFSGGFSNSGRK